MISTSEQSSPKSVPVLIKMSMKYKSARGTFSETIPFLLLKGWLCLPSHLPAGPTSMATRASHLSGLPGEPSSRPGTTLRGSPRERSGEGLHGASLSLQQRLRVASLAVLPGKE